MADHRQQVRGVRPDRTYVRLAPRGAGRHGDLGRHPPAGTAPARRRARRVTGCREVRPGRAGHRVGAAAAGCALATLAWWAGTFTLAVAAQVRRTVRAGRSGRSAGPARAAARPPSGTLVRRLAAAAGRRPGGRAGPGARRRPTGRRRPPRGVATGATGPAVDRPAERTAGWCGPATPSGRWPQHDWAAATGRNPVPWRLPGRAGGTPTARSSAPDPDLIRPGRSCPPPYPGGPMTVTPPPLTRPPHLLRPCPGSRRTTTKLDPETRSRRATASAHGQGHDHGPGWGAQPWSRALWLSRSCAERSARGP